MSGEAYNELWNLNWFAIPDCPYVMKYRFDEDGYILMISDLAAVFAEKLDEKAIQERFQILNPYAEMLPKVILKHVKQSLKNLFAGEQEHEPTKFKITLDSNKVTIQHQFNAKGVHFLFNFEPQKLSDNQFKAHILRPTLLRALILDEEKTTLERKVEELEGKQSSSSRSSERRNIKAIYSEMKESAPPGSGVVPAFLYLQKDKITLPESFQGSPNVSPMKGIHSSSTSSFSRKKLKDSKNESRNIPYEEGDSVMNLESQNRIQDTEEQNIETTANIEKIVKNEGSINEFDHSSNNLLAKAPKGNHSNTSEFPLKREIAEEEEDGKEESVSKPAPHLKPLPAKKKKLLKF